MYFTLPIVAALPALAYAHPFEGLSNARAANAISGPPTSSPGAPNVVKDMTLAGQDLATLSKAVSANSDDTTKYDYDELVAIINANTAVQYDINNATAATNATKTFSTSDSCSVASARDALMPTVSSTMKNFIAHYQAMNNTGIVGITLNNIELQREYARELVNAVAVKATGTCTSNAAAQSATMMSYFDKAIQAYQK